MATLQRKVTYRLYPNAQQETVLKAMLGSHQRLYNAALEQRIWAYRGQQRISPTFADQCKELTALRAECPEYAALNAQSCQVTLKRVDWAFQHFFRRVREKRGKAGFPRFKAYQRFSGWGYKTLGDGWRLIPRTCGKHGYVRLSGVGYIQMRGCPRTSGEPKTLEILHKNGCWYASVTLECEPQRWGGTEAVGLDWGVATLATLALSGGRYEEIANPRQTRNELKRLQKAQQDLARKQKGSHNRQKARQKVGQIQQRIAQRRQDFLHQESARLVKRMGLIATERLNVKAMTARGKGGKRGLNREILSTAPATFLHLLQAKAEEAALVWVWVPTRQVKPSQTCSGCGRQAKKRLDERVHACVCGRVCGRDENAARVMLNWALYNNATGQELAGCGVGSAGCHRSVAVKLPAAKQETPSTPALAG